MIRAEGLIPAVCRQRSASVGVVDLRSDTVIIKEFYV